MIGFRKRLTSRLEELGMGKSGLSSVFEEMDVTGRGELNVKDLCTVLFKLNFHVSKASQSVMQNQHVTSISAIRFYNTVL